MLLGGQFIVVLRTIATVFNRVVSTSTTLGITFQILLNLLLIFTNFIKLFL